MIRVLYLFALLALATGQEEPFTVEDFLNGQFTQTGFGGTWISDTEFTYTIAGQPGILSFNMQTLSSTVLVDGDLMAELNTTSPILSADREYILAPSEVQSVYRYSTTARFSLYDINTGTITPIADGQRLQLCLFGAGHSVAYVLDNDLYYLPGGRTTPIRITNDGIPGVVYNGHTDWVYEEDVMYSGQATWFSNDGSYLAFASFDDTEVETYSYYLYEDKEDPEDLYPELVHLKYPKVGRKNSEVQLRLVNLAALEAGLDAIQVLEAPASVTEDHILAGVVWASNTEIAVQWTNRRQNYNILRICNVNDINNCEEEERSQPNGWVDLALPRFSRDGDFYVSTRWSLEQHDGRQWKHLFVSMRLNGTVQSSSVTPGAFSVTSFLGMDNDNLAYYYIAAVPDAPWQVQVYQAGAYSDCISCDIVLPEGGPCTRASATLSTGGSYMSITCSSSNEVAAVYLVNPKTKEILYTWQDNQAVRDRLANKIRPGSIIFTVPLENGFPAPVRLHLPPGLNISDTETKYPLIYYVYSGPGTNYVLDSFTVGYHSYLTTSSNVIYMLADGTGSGLKSADMLYALNNALGTVEVETHFVILKEVLARYDFIDRDRIAIWGHSYGGYATILTLIKDDENLFKCGVSGAPVTSWLYYNTMYTERYMGLPTVDDNLSGYEAGDTTRTEMAEKLRGKNLYLMHGNADDNVHFQNAAMLMKKLQQLNIPFDQMSYPDEAHSLVGTNLHRYNTMNRFFSKHLDYPV